MANRSRPTQPSSRRLGAGSRRDLTELTRRSSRDDAKAHIEFQRRMNDRLTESGELLEAQALTGPELAKVVIHDGVGAPVVTDGPFPEGKELLAGYRIVDVESMERAIEIAAEASAAPGPGGKPIKTAIEVRELMGAPTSDE